MEKKVKITKAMVLAEIKKQVEKMTFEGAVTAEDVTAYCDTTLAQLDAKNVKAREKAAEKRAEADEFTIKVLEVVTDEFQTADAITEQLDVETTVAKVRARLTKLIAEDKVVKETMKVGDSRKVCYKLNVPTDEDAE